MRVWEYGSDVNSYLYAHTLILPYYFSCPSASPIRFQAFSILAILFANEKRIHFGSPNASPITEDTCAVLSKYMQGHLVAYLFTPSDLP